MHGDRDACAPVRSILWAWSDSGRRTGPGPSAVSSTACRQADRAYPCATDRALSARSSARTVLAPPVATPPLLMACGMIARRSGPIRRARAVRGTVTGKLRRARENRSVPMRRADSRMPHRGLERAQAAAGSRSIGRRAIRCRADVAPTSQRGSAGRKNSAWIPAVPGGPDAAMSYCPIWVGCMVAIHVPWQNRPGT